MVVTLGVNALPCVTPAFTHVYVKAPLPVSATACPKQMLLPVVLTVKLGTLELTVSCIAADVTQLAVLVPVTE